MQGVGFQMERTWGAKRKDLAGETLVPTLSASLLKEYTIPLRAVHLSRHKWLGGLVHYDSGRLSERTQSSSMVWERASAVLSISAPGSP